MNNEITVIVTTYNNNNCIRECLLSVINQTQSPKSIIVIDDCSEDILTLKKIIYSLNNTSNIKIELLINEKNSGPGFSRNKAWSLVKTEFIAFLDADDIFYKDKLKEQIKLFEKYPDISMVSSKKKLNNKASDINNASYKIKIISITMILTKNYIATSSVLIKSDIKERFNSNYYAEDYYLWITMLLNNNLIILMDTNTCSEIFNIKNMNKLSSNTLKMQIGIQKVLSSFYSKDIKLNFLILLSQIYSILKFIFKSFFK